MISQGVRERWDRQIAYLLEHGERAGLSQWEADFLDGASIRREFGKDLTMQQSISLNRIYKKAQGRVG